MGVYLLQVSRRAVRPRPFSIGSFHRLKQARVSNQSLRVLPLWAKLAKTLTEGDKDDETDDEDDSCSSADDASPSTKESLDATLCFLLAR